MQLYFNNKELQRMMRQLFILKHFSKSSNFKLERQKTMKKFFILFYLSLIFQTPFVSFAKSPKAKKTGVTFDKALPEDISNENFPDRIESFDFPKANLLDLVKAISKLTGMNFILDPSLNSKQISIIASSPITVAEAYKAFLSALAANDYSVVKSGAFWKIQSTEKLHKGNTEVYSGDYFPGTDQLITRIIKLKYIGAKELEASIKWLLTKEPQISSHESSNSLIISDYGSVIERVMKIINEMDVPGLEEDVYTIEIEYASAADLEQILTKLLLGKVAPTSHSSRSKSRNSSVYLSPNFKSKGNQSKISHIISDNRTNSLVVKADKRGIARVRSLVKKLDVQANLSRTGGVWVYNVLYGTAEEVYNTLMGIKPASQNTSSNKRGRYFISSRRQNQNKATKKSAESPLFPNVNIMADHNTNSLVISARSKYEYGRVLNVLKKIDVARDQVFIQAIILEMLVGRGNTTEFNLASTLLSLVTENKTLDHVFGPNPSFFKTVGESAVAGFLTNSIGVENITKAQFGPGLILGLPFIKLLEGFNNVGAFADEPFDGPGIFPDWNTKSDEAKTELERQYVTSKASTNNNSALRQSLSTSFYPLIRLLRNSDNINVLSTPQLTTLDNAPAFIEVGEDAPVGLKTSTTATGLSNQDVERKKIAIRLEITPYINPETGTVKMDIKQKFDDFSNRISTATELNKIAVSVTKREIETQMVLHDGDTAVLGGLLSDKNVTNRNKVPLLGDLPFVGWLFRGSEVQTEKKNLLVFITPTIISGEEQKKKSQEILDKKLEERIDFIDDYMKGNDLHEKLLGTLVPRAKELKVEEEEKQVSFFEKLKNNFKRDKKKENFKSPLENQHTNLPLEPVTEAEASLFSKEPQDFEEEDTTKDFSFSEKDKTAPPSEEDSQSIDFSDIPDAISGPSSDSSEGGAEETQSSPGDSEEPEIKFQEESGTEDLQESGTAPNIEGEDFQEQNTQDFEGFIEYSDEE